jgi:ankyrin repeat protein
VAVVQLLLEKGADIEAKGNSGQTALQLAAKNEHEATARADIEAKDSDGRTELRLAAGNRHGAILLLEEGGSGG